VAFGQNQQTRAMKIGIDPQTTAHGVKIDEISMIVVAIADQSGQIELRGEDSRACGHASATELTKSSRRSTRRPDATGGSPPVSQSGLALSTTGIHAKL
jgi:hypothetical protein